MLSFLLLAGLICQPVLAQDADPDEIVGAPGGYDLSVNNRGEAVVTVPIQVPPGVAGMTPSLALVYNSNAGNGHFGYGWNLDLGFPQYITRGRTLLARDRVVRGVNYDTGDRLYWGGKYLVCVSGSYLTLGSTYRTEVESFAEISVGNNGAEPTGQIAYFEVLMPDGTKLVYGEDGPVNAQNGLHKPGGLSHTLRWALRRVEDPFGNQIEYFYHAEHNYNEQGQSTGHTGEFLLQFIIYGNIDEGHQTTIKLNRISDDGTDDTPATDWAFLENPTPGHLDHDTYDPRSDSVTRFVAGGALPLTRRVDSITIHQGTAQSEIAKYDLTYLLGQASLRNRLVEVTYEALSTAGERQSVLLASFEYSDCARDATRYNVGDFELFDSEVGPQLASYGYAVESVAGLVVLHDFNTDGLPDMAKPPVNHAHARIALNEADGLASFAPWTTFLGDYGTARFGDFDGDGRIDIIAAKAEDLHLIGYNTDGDGFTEREAEWTWPDNPERQASAHVGDFDGDGRDDYLWLPFIDPATVVSGTRSASILFGSTPDAAKDEYRQADFEVDVYEIPRYRHASFHVADVTGDGCENLVWALDYTGIDGQPYAAVYVLERSTSDNTKWIIEKWLDSADWGNPRIFLACLADINGDGMRDAVLSWQDYLSYNLSTGDQFVSERSFRKLDGYVIDFLDQSGSVLYTIETSGDLDGGLIAGHSSWFMGQVFAADFNGDGFEDVVYRDVFEESQSPPGFGKPGVGVIVMSNGNGFDSPQAFLPVGIEHGGINSLLWHTTAVSPFPGTPWAKAYQGGPIHFTDGYYDFSRDGLPDISVFSMYGDFFVGQSDAVVPDLLASVESGLGGREYVEYGVVSGDNHVAAVQPVEYPIANLWNDSRPIVYRRVQDLGEDESIADSRTRSFVYIYSGGRIDHSGRGFLGYQSFTTFDEQTGLLKFQFLDQAFPLTGMTHREETYYVSPEWPGVPGVYIDLVAATDSTNVASFVSGLHLPIADRQTIYPFTQSSLERRWNLGDERLIYDVTGTTESAVNSPGELFEAIHEAEPYIEVHTSIDLDTPVANP